MSKQRPNPDTMANELAGASAFFRQAPTQTPAKAEPVTEPKPAPIETNPAVDHQKEYRPERHNAERTPRTPVRPDRRQMIRHAFELYLDQLDSLRDLADAQRRRGEPASMSRMVREALDRYLDDESQQQHTKP
jgi:hypothetical protein